MGGLKLTQRGLIFNIQRFTIHDGPGIRTELFFKGCPLRCEWCSNPESFMSLIQPGVYKAKCISQKKCGSCIEACPKEDILIFKNGKLNAIDRNQCIGCLECFKACPSDAIKQWGNLMSVDECMNLIKKDKGYYERSGGGVTVSGGEPLIQSDFVLSLFKACKAEGIHTCCESSLYATWNEIVKVLPYSDLIISDIKHMDTKIHKKYTGVNNELILENLKRIAQENCEVILRIPIIPNVNDDMENMKATADFIVNEMKGRVRTLQLLSFMRLGEEKYASLGIPYKMSDVKMHRKSFQKHINEIADYFNRRGIHCVVGTKEKSET